MSIVYHGRLCRIVDRPLLRLPLRGPSHENSYPCVEPYPQTNRRHIHLSTPHLENPRMGRRVVSPRSQGSQRHQAECLE